MIQNLALGRHSRETLRAFAPEHVEECLENIVHHGNQILETTQISSTVELENRGIVT